MAAHDPRTIELFEVIGSHFVDVFYNHAYQAALQSWKAKKSASVTDAYTEALQAYVAQNKNDAQVYQRTVRNLHEYVKVKAHAYSVTAYAAFVDRVSRALLPEDVYAATRSEERDEVVGTAVCDLIGRLCVCATSAGVLHRVIDDRQRSVETARLLQDHAVQALVESRERLHSQFLGEAAQAKAAGPRDQVHKLLAALQLLAAEKAGADAALGAAQEELGAAQEELGAARAAAREQKRAVRAALAALEGQLAALARENQAMRAALARGGGREPPRGGAPAPVPVRAAPPLTMAEPRATLAALVDEGPIDPFAALPARRAPDSRPRAAPAPDESASAADAELAALFS